MTREEEEQILRIIARIHKLSLRPENPGVAYRNLETIHALVEALDVKIKKNMLIET